MALKKKKTRILMSCKGGGKVCGGALRAEEVSGRVASKCEREKKNKTGPFLKPNVTGHEGGGQWGEFISF